MSCRFLPVNGILFLFLLNSCSINVDSGPFAIPTDAEMLHGKQHYLEMIRKAERPDSLPNIVLILADDLGKYDMSLYDPQGIPTPNINRLASSGITYERAYASSPVCSPSRAGLLTGRYQQRYGYERQPMTRYPRNRMEYWFVDHFMNTDPMELVSPMSSPDKEEMSRQGLPASEIMLQEVLVERGYHTGIIGKWHLGYAEDFLPHKRGFQDQYGFYEAYSYYYPPGTEGMVEHRHDYFASKHIWRKKRSGNSAIRAQGKVVEDSAYLTFSIAERACAYIEEHRSDPFFLYLPFSAPHTPFQVPQEYYDRFPGEQDHNRRVYAGMIAALDDAIGQIMDQLAESGLLENTLVIFTSDNGGASYTGATDNGPLRAGKFTQFEGGLQVPLALSMPGTIPAKLRESSPVSQLDIFATCLSLTGTTRSKDRELDGLDLLEGIWGTGDPYRVRPLYWRCEFNKGVLQYPWKLLINSRDGQELLYHLDRDPGEVHNQADEMPELVLQLRKLLNGWEEELMDPLWPGVMEYRMDTDPDSIRWAI